MWREQRGRRGASQGSGKSVALLTTVREVETLHVADEADGLMPGTIAIRSLSVRWMSWSLGLGALTRRALVPSTSLGGVQLTENGRGRSSAGSLVSPRMPGAPTHTVLRGFRDLRVRSALPWGRVIPMFKWHICRTPADQCLRPVHAVADYDREHSESLVIP